MARQHAADLRRTRLAGTASRYQAILSNPARTGQLSVGLANLQKLAKQGDSEAIAEAIAAEGNKSRVGCHLIARGSVRLSPLNGGGESTHRGHIVIEAQDPTTPGR